MAKKRKKQTLYRLWNGNGLKDCFVPIGVNLISSEPFCKLTASQKALFMVCAAESALYSNAPKYMETDEETGEIVCRAHKDQFYMNPTIWCGKYRLYARSSTSSFARDRDALIYAGFIDCVIDNAERQRSNIYSMSTRWLTGKNYENTPKEVMTASLKAGKSPDPLDAS